ncbi:MAG: recombinase zinc beta ribbon domain-containing protein, partial [Oscillospiraceae bacterium]|nr:recombinase zinc beta ribbon domain-containing protein [Oscillospiraceae bacterium]
KLNNEILMIYESLTSIREISHTHKNKELLDSLTADSLALLPDLQQFEDTVKEDIHRIDEIIQSINNTVHTHENLDVLNGITADRVASWDSMKTSINNFMNSMTVYSEKVSNTAARVGSAESEINALQKTIEALQKQIDSVSGSSAVILFQNGADALEKYGETTYIFYNNGYRSLNGFVQTYPNFCSAENDYALYYNQTDFNWAGEIYTMILADPLTHRSKRNCGEVEQFYIEGDHMPIIDKEVFEKAQERFAERMKANIIAKPYHGIIFCGYCGATMFIKRYPQRNYYICTTHKKTKTCDCKRQRGDILDEIVMSALEIQEFDPFAVSERIQKIQIFNDKIIIQMKDGRTGEWQKQ